VSQPLILLCEPIHERGRRILEAAGRVVLPASPYEADLLPHLSEAAAIVVRALSRIDRRIIDAAPKLKVVGRHGIGVDNIDLDAATARGVWVVNTPDAPTEGVAEHFVMLALMLAKRFPYLSKTLRRGAWQQRFDRPGVELAGRTVGLVGFGRTGRRVAEICGRGFGCRILYQDVVSCPKLEGELGAQQVKLERLLHQSDFVSLHVPLLPETKHLIGAREIALMKPAAYLLNLCRGPVWDEYAVADALREGRIAGAATDVFEDEPVPPDHPLLGFENFIATPHTASSSLEGLERMSLVAEDISAVLAGKRPRFPVNRLDS
jgi:D-3-phosphoglycerate dehydrogenase